MAMSETQPEHFELAPHPEVAIALVHGRWGSHQQFKPLRRQIEPYVGAVITPDLPVDQPGLTYEDYADVILEAIKDYDRVELWGHSRAPESLARVALRQPDKITRLGYICPRIPRATGQPKPPHQPARLTPRYRQWEGAVGEELTDADFQDFREIMCGMSSEAEARWIFGTLRRQAPLLEAPMISHQPDVATDVILATADGARAAEGVRADARAYSKVNPIEVLSDHYPHVNQTHFLGQLIVSRIGAAPFRYNDPKDQAPREALDLSSL